MELNRRELIVLAGVAAVGGCAPNTGSIPTPSRGPVDVGSIDDYPHDGVYSRFRDSHGFFIIRQGNDLFAQSAICTHRACRLKVQGGGFLCPCHGSKFTSYGQITRGPARRDLPHYPIEKDSTGRLIVRTDRPIRLDQFHVVPPPINRQGLAPPATPSKE